MGTPLGDPAFIQTHLDKKAVEQRTIVGTDPHAQICNQLGWFFCTALQPGRIICCVWWNPSL